MKLERDGVVRVALRLLDERGLDGLSLRRLAAELGVKAPALYWYFESKQELLDEMAEAMLEDHAPPDRPAPGQAWDAWMAERARTHRRAMLTYRDGARLHAGTRPTARHRPVLAGMLQVLGEAGFPPLEAISGVLAISHYTVGSAIEQQAAAARPAAGTGAGSPGSPGYDFDATYEHGLQLLLAGMRHLGASSR